MKILIDLQSTQAGSGIGGIGRYSYNLFEYIVKNNKVDEICVLLNGSLSLEVINELEKLVSRNSIYIFYPFSNTKMICQDNIPRSELSELIREYTISLINPDILFITSLIEGYFDDVVTSVGKIFPKEKTVTIIYDLIPLATPDSYLTNENIKIHYLKKIEELKENALLLSISQYSKFEAENLLEIDSSKVINISSGVDTKFKKINISRNMQEELHKKYNVKNKFLMYTSSFDVRKNQKSLIKAYAMLDQKLRNDMNLLLVGNVSEEVKMELDTFIKDQGLKANEVLILGYVNDDDLVKLYNMADIFVFPSLKEGFGLPILEAMSCGTAVLGSKTTSIVEVVGNEEALFDPLDIHSMSNKIKELLENNQLRQKNCEHSIEQSKLFSWDNTAIRAINAIEKYYKSLDPRQYLYKDYYKEVVSYSQSIVEKYSINEELVVDYANLLEKNINLHQKKVGLITTWNTRCGIASYSKYLSREFIDTCIVFAQKASIDELVCQDENFVLREWNVSRDTLEQMFVKIVSLKLKVVFIQFNYGFFNFYFLKEFIEKLYQHSIKVSITFHSTTDVPDYKEKRILILKDVLLKCENIFIHTKKDKIVFSKLGIDNNVVLLNQGIIDITSNNVIKKEQVFTLATYGFFLPNKGLIDLIEAFNLLIQDGYNLKLKMYNAKYNEYASGNLINQAKELIKKYQLEQQLTLNTNYLTDKETIEKLSKTDLIIFPYKKTGESSSAAIRMAIASKVNIATTPQTIFNEVKDFVFTFEGDSVENIADGLKNIIPDIKEQNEKVKQMNLLQESFRTENLYSKVSKKVFEYISEPII